MPEPAPWRIDANRLALPRLRLRLDGTIEQAKPAAEHLFGRHAEALRSASFETLLTAAARLLHHTQLVPGLRASHSLRGACSTIGAMPLADALETFEAALASPADSATLHARHRQVAAEVQTLLRELQDGLGRAGGAPTKPAAR